ncbi:MAG TPA: hypothetical protein VND89_06730 [Acidimicrobiales bacterium]|nr:hypothetical protein [Acidimicrobiales bacterium]
MKITGYAYPWDYVGDPGAATRAGELGVDVVALAATYHASRTVSPLHPSRRVTDVPTSNCYVPVREVAWRGRRLVPSSPTWLEDPDAFALAHRALEAQGLAIDAWIVLTHHDELGYANPDLAVRNAFGEVYPYALCPQSEEVREYCLTLVEEVLNAHRCRGVVLEACGPMGLDHGTVHDKREFAHWTTTDEELLSLCFCDACRDGLVQHGIDVDDLAGKVRCAIGTSAESPEEALGSDVAHEVAKFRSKLSTELRHLIVERVRHLQPGATITLHASANTWATGSFPTSGDTASLEDVTTAVARCWDAPSAEQELRTLRERAPATSHLGAYLRMDRGWSDTALNATKIGRYVEVGMDELHLYHLGLLSRKGLEATRHVIDIAREN